MRQRLKERCMGVKAEENWRRFFLMNETASKRKVHGSESGRKRKEK